MLRSIINTGVVSASRPVFRSRFSTFSLQSAKFQPTFAKKSKKSAIPIKDTIRSSDKTPVEIPTETKPGIFKRMYNGWCGISFKLRMYVCISTFVVAWLADYISQKVYENARIKQEAERLAKIEFERLQQGKIEQGEKQEESS
ncbi:hypothetical protein DASC09_029800 [Saccharomycopsis crataegensis]|uniref:Uncharacterized protein n=1 Tax=Saccharomycopsis crataegensis TaxID=43959 RepID=A0AAV5QM82_9ASCO|nr:hypothetical protein DASC09_029800 [Saccharomycopsis crataegensis]